MVELNAVGIPCPKPAEMARQKMRHMQDGERIAVKTNSLRCVRDLERLCLFLDHTHVSTEAKGGYTVVTIQKGLGA